MKVESWVELTSDDKETITDGDLAWSITADAALSNVNLTLQTYVGIM